jgi:formate hydrogenlyase transcriptional activator
MGHSIRASSSEPGFDTDSLFRLAAESLPSGVLVVTGDGTILFANAEVERQCHYTREELVGQPVEIVLPKALPRVSQMGAGCELFGRRRDGSEFPVEIGLNPIETPRGTFVLATIVDITARKQVDRATSVTVEEQLEFERLVAESSAEFINVPADRVGDAIRDALGRIGEALDLDWCTFCRIQPDGLPVDLVSWVGPGFPPTPASIAAETRFPWVLKTIRAGQVVRFSSVDEIPDPVDRENYRSLGIRSAVAVPLSVGGENIGAMGFNLLREERSWDPDTVHRLRVIATAFGNVLARQKADEALGTALAEVERLRDQLHAENAFLRREARQRLGTGPIIGDSPAVRRVLEQVQQVAATDSTVLLLGETGTGKELFATHIHEASARRARTMVRVNCAAIPDTLMESELFGREKGAFTGALARQAGRFELADHSTIFLDEIGDLPGDVQMKLLRVLEERQIERLGSPKPIHVDVRVIAATHRNLEQRIAAGSFREDLYYRLNVFPIQVPPLRERVEDISLLVWRFVEEFSRTFGKRIEAIPRETMEALQEYAWPGNIRELRNVVERAMIVATGPRLTIALPATKMSPAKRSVKLVDVEGEHIRHVLEGAHWRIRGAGGAADRLGLRPTTLETRMAKLGIKRPHL